MPWLQTAAGWVVQTLIPPDYWCAGISNVGEPYFCRQVTRTKYKSSAVALRQDICGFKNPHQKRNAFWEWRCATPPFFSVVSWDHVTECIFMPSVCGRRLYTFCSWIMLRVRSIEVLKFVGILNSRASTLLLRIKDCNAWKMTCCNTTD